MKSKDKQRRPSSDRAKVSISIVITTLGAFASVIASMVAKADLLKLPSAIVVGGVAVLITAAFTSALTLRERGPTRLAKLKDELSRAYLSALDDSALNPLSGEGR